MAGSGPFGVNPALEAKLAYDAVKDFEPIANIGLTPQIFAVGPSAKFRTLKDFVAAAKASPGTIDYGSLGKGTTSHLAMEYFQSAAGIKLNHIPFKGSSEAHTQVMGGNVTMVSDAVPGILSHIKSGKLTPLGIASKSRSPFAPDIPTLEELGYPGFEAVGWIGFAAPAKTPVAILDRLNAEVKRMLADPQVKEKLDKLYFVPVGDSRAEFGAFIKAEIAKWTKVAKDAGIKSE
jgi:tripartite-type tricarboxylate transporter receptor subunit TctC